MEKLPGPRPLTHGQMRWRQQVQIAIDPGVSERHPYQLRIRNGALADPRASVKFARTSSRLIHQSIGAEPPTQCNKSVVSADYEAPNASANESRNCSYQLLVSGLKTIPGGRQHARLTSSINLLGTNQD